MMHDHIYKPRSVPAPKRSRRCKYVASYITQGDYLRLKKLAGEQSISEYLRVLIREDIYRHDEDIPRRLYENIL